MTGKTHAICTAAKAIDATVICATERRAAQVRRLYGVKAITMHGQDRQRVGSGGSFVWDYFAADLAWDELNDKIESIRKKYKNQRDENVRLRRQLKEARNGEKG
jgi:hypothetical protein